MITEKRPFEVGIDSYSLKPLNISVFECLEWAAKNGADGVQFSEVNLPPGRELDGALLKDLSQFAKDRKLYIEWGGGQHIPLTKPFTRICLVIAPEAVFGFQVFYYRSHQTVDQFSSLGAVTVAHQASANQVVPEHIYPA